MTRSSRHAALPLGQWPAPDRLAWEAALLAAEFLDQGGKAADWRPASRHATQGAYARLLAWLVTSGVDLESERPAARITPDRMRAYITFLRDGSSSVTVASYLGILCMMLLALFPEENWCWLQALQRQFHRQAWPSRNKQARLVSSQQLLRLGLDLIEAARVALEGSAASCTELRRTIAAARNYRDGLMIALLALRPLRVKNLLQIELGRHLKPAPSGHTLAFSADETKNHRSLRTAWPPMLELSLARYVTHVRPLLIKATPRGKSSKSKRAAGAMLWLAQGGTPFTEGALHKALRRHTIPRFGHPINAHLFRDCVATTLANLDPDNVRHAIQLLGHTRLQTTERSYIAPDSHEALTRHHDLIAATRSSGRGRRTRQ